MLGSDLHDAVRSQENGLDGGKAAVAGRGAERGRRGRGRGRGAVGNPFNGLEWCHSVVETKTSLRNGFSWSPQGCLDGEEEEADSRRRAWGKGIPAPPAEELLFCSHLLPWSPESRTPGLFFALITEGRADIRAFPELCMGHIGVDPDGIWTLSLTAPALWLLAVICALGSLVEEEVLVWRILRSPMCYFHSLWRRKQKQSPLSCSHMAFFCFDLTGTGNKSKQT